MTGASDRTSKARRGTNAALGAPMDGAATNANKPVTSPAQAIFEPVSRLRMPTSSDRKPHCLYDVVSNEPSVGPISGRRLGLSAQTRGCPTVHHQGRGVAIRRADGWETPPEPSGRWASGHTAPLADSSPARAGP